MRLSLPVVITPTRVELGLRCQRRHTVADLLSAARYYSPSLEFGSVIHAGAAAWWRARLLPRGVALNEAMLAIKAEWTKRFDQNPLVSQKDISLAMAEAMIEGYSNQATLAGPFELSEGYQVVSVEDRLEIPLEISGGRKSVLSFQTDRVIYNKQENHLVIIDSKTAGRIDSRWMRQWESSLQMKLYKAAASVAYDFQPDVIDVVIEGILKDVPTKIAYVQCPDWSVALLDEAVQQAAIVAGRDFELLTQTDLPVIEAALTTTAVNYMSCYEYGVECPFRALCLAEPQERVALLKADYFEVPEADQSY